MLSPEMTCRIVLDFNLSFTFSFLATCKTFPLAYLIGISDLHDRLSPIVSVSLLMFPD